MPLLQIVPLMLPDHISGPNSLQRYTRHLSPPNLASPPQPPTSASHCTSWQGFLPETCQTASPSRLLFTLPWSLSPSSLPDLFLPLLPQVLRSLPFGSFGILHAHHNGLEKWVSGSVSAPGYVLEPCLCSREGSSKEKQGAQHSWGSGASHRVLVTDCGCLFPLLGLKSL